MKFTFVVLSSLILGIGTAISVHSASTSVSLIKKDLSPVDNAVVITTHYQEVRDKEGVKQVVGQTDKLITYLGETRLMTPATKTKFTVYEVGSKKLRATILLGRGNASFVSFEANFPYVIEDRDESGKKLRYNHITVYSSPRNIHELESYYMGCNLKGEGVGRRKGSEEFTKKWWDLFKTLTAVDITDPSSSSSTSSSSCSSSSSSSSASTITPTQEK